MEKKAKSKQTAEYRAEKIATKSREKDDKSECFVASNKLFEP